MRRSNPVWILLLLVLAPLPAVASMASQPSSPALDVLDYDVELTVRAMDATPIPARVRLRFRALESMTVLPLHVEPEKINVTQVRDAEGRPLLFALVPGTPNEHGLTGTLLQIALARAMRAGEEAVVEIDYRITVQGARDQRGLYYVADDHGSRVLATRNWPYFARFWLPSNDHPIDAARFRFLLRAPAGVQALANGALVNAGSGPSEEVRVWEITESIPTYAAQVIIGDLAVARSSFCLDSSGRPAACTPENRTIFVEFYYPPSLPNRSTFEAAIEKGMNALRYYSNILGPYRHGRAGFARIAHPYNMETATLIVLITPSQAVHEVVHHWWGNGVRIRNWSDFWMGEGLTTYFTGFFDEVQTGANTSCFTTTRKLDVSRNQDPLDFFNLDPYCVGAAAIAGYRALLAAQLALPPRDSRAVEAFLEVFRRIYVRFNGEAIDTRTLSRALATETAQVLRSRGVSITQAQAESLIRAWEEQWFTGLEPWAAETPLRRRAVRR